MQFVDKHGHRQHTRLFVASLLKPIPAVCTSKYLVTASLRYRAETPPAQDEGKPPFLPPSVTIPAQNLCKTLPCNDITQFLHYAHLTSRFMKKLAFVLGLFMTAQGFHGVASAQNFIGTNNAGAGTNFNFTVGAGATNLSLVVSNSSTAYSYLLLKNGGTPTDTSFDFAARLNGATNEINLESPEFAAGTYGLRVSTPGSSTL